MVARAIVVSASCVLASLVDAHDTAVQSSAASERSASADSIPVSSAYSFVEKSKGKECSEHHRERALVGSWGECQSKCDDLDDNCQFFTVYSKYVTGKDKNKVICQIHKACDSEKLIDSGDHFSAVFQKQELTYQTLDNERILRHHNIMRCMHDAPPLQWSAPAAEEASTYASKAFGDAQHIQPETEWNPMPGDFDELEQLVSYTVQPQTTSPALTRQWWDNTLPIEDWYNNDKTNGPLLWPSTAYVGCGSSITTPLQPVNSAMDMVCNYGPEKRADPSKHLDKTVRPRNKKTAKDCAFSVDSQNRFKAAFPPAKDSARKVSIAYTPKPRTGLSQQAGECGEISEYRLVFDAQNNKVQLVGVDPETMGTAPKPCKDSGFDDFHPWGYDTDAYFTEVTGTKQCLKVNPAGLLPPNPKTQGTLAVDSGEGSCGRHNYFGLDDTKIDINGAWHFMQDSFSLMCMMDVEEGTGVKSVLDTLPAGYPDDKTNPADCSGRWTVRAFGDDFNPPVPPTLEAFKDTDTCSECRSRVGNFACAVGRTIDNLKCALAPTEFDCTQLGDSQTPVEWCGPKDWKVNGDCAPDSYQCKGAVDPHHAEQAGCVQLGGVYKTHFNDCALIADGVYTENDCQNGLKNNNGYEDRDVSDCVNLVKQTHDKTANVFDFVAGYKYDVPQHAPYCRLWHCSGLKDNTLPKQDGDQAWLIAYKTKNTLSQNSVSMMV